MFLQIGPLVRHRAPPCTRVKAKLNAATATPTPERRAAFAEALKPNFSEWDAVMNETTSLEQWARLLPRDTLLVCDPGTVLPIREIANSCTDHVRGGPTWKCLEPVTWLRSRILR
jgi:hypothetical protein